MINWNPGITLATGYFQKNDLLLGYWHICVVSRGTNPNGNSLSLCEDLETTPFDTFSTEAVLIKADICKKCLRIAEEMGVVIDPNLS